MCEHANHSLDVFCVDPTDLVKRTPLHVAVRNGTIGVTEVLLLHGADINLPESDGTTVLHEAAKYGYLEICCILIGHGVNVETRDAQGRTPLHYAASVGSPETIQTILAATNTGVTVQDNNGETPLHTISASLLSDDPPPATALLRCCDILLAQSERISTITDKNLNNALHSACMRYSMCVAKSKKSADTTEAATLVSTANALVINLVERCPTMLVQRNKRGKYPYQLLPSGELFNRLKEQAAFITEQPTMVAIVVS